jgi:aryl-alcohol dehydrogenase-like predicted oxidoreductase
MIVQTTGKVRYIGHSNFTGWQIAKAYGISEARGFQKFVSAQSYYSLAGREPEFEVLPAVRDLKMGAMVWSPLASGFLTGKYTGENAASGRRAVFVLGLQPSTRPIPPGTVCTNGKLEIGRSVDRQIDGAMAGNWTDRF